MWYQNLLVTPKVDLQDGAIAQPMLAHEADGTEREIWWQRAVSAWAAYEDYQNSTDRLIPVLVLEPDPS
jgi:deazaflavin-dependent oxidoreductase (nitroreductase family)